MPPRLSVLAPACTVKRRAKSPTTSGPPPAPSPAPRARLATPGELRAVASTLRMAGANADADHLEAMAQRYGDMSESERERHNEFLR